MSERKVEFTHDGHTFHAIERAAAASSAEATRERLTWVVTMDGAPALEFQGGYPYRDDDVQKRIVEWYEIQKPR